MCAPPSGKREIVFLVITLFSSLSLPPSLIPIPGALGPFMLKSSSFGETPIPVCSCGAGGLLIARAL